MSPADTVPPPTERSTRILEAACRVIVREGAHGLRMASVAEEADVSKALVHYYFATRQELLRNAFAFSEQRWQAAIDAELATVSTGAARVERMLLVSVEPGAAPSASSGRSATRSGAACARTRSCARSSSAPTAPGSRRVVELIEEGTGGRLDRRPSVDAAPTGWRLAAAADGLRLAALPRRSSTATGAAADARGDRAASSATA